MEIIPLHTKVDKFIQLPTGVVVLEDPKGFPRGESNLYYLQFDGKILWKAEKPEPQTLYTRVRLNEDGQTLGTYTQSGHACDLDLQTGKILEQTHIQ
ncbi:MAG: hypothetical protein HFACDABA_02415 [Anaerolineales bacterium]|nr:hypothetical protein [Anaerolineales bacterium]